MTRRHVLLQGGIHLLVVLYRLLLAIGIGRSAYLGHLASVLLGALFKDTHAQAILLVSTLLLSLIEALAIDSVAVSHSRWLIDTHTLRLKHLLVIKATHIA